VKSLLKLKPFLRPYKSLILLSLILAIPLSALRAAPAPLLKYFVDDLLVKKDSTKLYLFPLLIIGIYVLNFIVRFFHYYLLRIVIVRVNQRVKNELYEHLLGLSADHFTKQSTGNLISRVAMDPQFLDGGLSCMNVIIREPVTFIFLFLYALKLNWKLTIVTLIIFPPLAYVFSASSRNLKRYIGRLTEESGRIYSTLQESFTGVRIIKTFRLERYVRRRFMEQNENYVKYYLKIAKLEEVSHPLVELLIAFLIAIIIYFGGRQVLAGKITSGDLIAFFATFAMLINPIRNFNEVNMKLSQAAGACERIFEVFKWKSHLVENQNPKSFKTFTSGISLHQVTFAYPDAPQRNVLNQVSFEVPKGQSVALVGASGAGKSSLVNLLPRIFDVTQGSIRIDGNDIRELSLEDLRRQIAVVSQEVFLFNDTIEENIRCGKLSATDEEIREAARRAHATEFINSLPDGYQTNIGDRGQKLSGGQRQRISIARAFLREAPILILDEATSSLDNQSERAVQEALEELMQNRTTIIIAHRLSTIQNVDHIYVMKDGEIVEDGKHEALIRKDGVYSAFYKTSEEVEA